MTNRVTDRKCKTCVWYLNPCSALAEYCDQYQMTDEEKERIKKVKEANRKERWWKVHDAVVKMCKELDIPGSVLDEHDLYTEVWEIYCKYRMR